MSVITKPDGISWNDIFRQTFKEASRSLRTDGRGINSMLENAAADAGEPDAKHGGEKMPKQKATAAGVG